jgi:hypothetical protein
MSLWIDHIVIGLVVALSALYAIYSLGPKSLRARIRKHIFRRGESVSADAGCGGCGNCGPSASSQAETKISLASVRKDLRSPR